MMKLEDTISPHPPCPVDFLTHTINGGCTITYGTTTTITTTLLYYYLAQNLVNTKKTRISCWSGVDKGLFKTVLGRYPISW